MGKERETKKETAGYFNESVKRTEGENPAVVMRVKQRLWRMANKSLLATNLIEVEKAWDQRDDKGLLEAICHWGWDEDPMLETLFIELALEDEERTWSVYRKWLNWKMQDNPAWRDKKVAHARGRLELYREISDQLNNTGKYGKTSALREKMWVIVVEERKSCKAAAAK